MADKSTKLPIKTGKKAPPAKQEHWSPFESLHREIDRLFDDFRAGSWHFPFGRPSGRQELAWPGRAAWQVAPAVDLVEKDSGYEITAELPGMDEKDVEIKLSNGMLTIKGEKSEEKEEREKDYYLSERRYGSFQRSFRVPDGVDADKIEASFSKGVLTVTLPKTAEARKKEKKIAVKGI